MFFRFYFLQCIGKPLALLFSDYIKIFILNEIAYIFSSNKTIFVVRMRGSRKFCQRESNFATFCFWGSKIALKAGHHHFNGVSLAGDWWPNIECWLGNFGFPWIRTSCAKKTIFLWFSSGGSGPPCPFPPLHTHTLDPRMVCFENNVTFSNLNITTIYLSHNTVMEVIL